MLCSLANTETFDARADLFIRHLLLNAERREGKGATNAVKPLRHGEASVQRISAALRSVAFDETNAQRLFCSGGTDSPPPWLERWVETAQASTSLESGSGVDEVESDSVNSGMHLCGVEAGAQILHLLAKEPVLVEPFPVQMMALTSSRSEKNIAAAQGAPMDGASTADAAASDDTLATCKYLTDATLVRISFVILCSCVTPLHSPPSTVLTCISFLFFPSLLFTRLRAGRHLLSTSWISTSGRRCPPLGREGCYVR